MKKENISFNFIIIGILMLITIPAYAYLDSGTGSVIIQMLFAGIAGLLAILKLYWEKVKTRWRRFSQFFKSKKIIEKSTIKSHHDKTR